VGLEEVVFRPGFRNLAWVSGCKEAALGTVPVLGYLFVRQFKENKPRLVSLGAPIRDTDTRQLFSIAVVALMSRSRSECYTNAGAPVTRRAMNHFRTPSDSVVGRHGP
jgi:hypothetical protein